MYQFPSLMLAVGHVICLACSWTYAEIVVLSPNNETLNTFSDLPASDSFAPPIPDEGVWGHIAYTDPQDACLNVSNPPNVTGNWIAVISKSRRCGFYVQVSNAHMAGFSAAIVYNNISNKLEEMKGTPGHHVKIPATFIGLRSSNYLSQYDKRENVHVLIYNTSSVNDEFILIILAAISSFSAFVVLAVVIGIGLHNCYRNRAQLLSRWKLKRLPLHTFKKGDLYENCAICLEEYNEGEKLRILPCAHAFHSSCIDVWLTKNKKTCPLCNETVDPRRSSNSESRAQRHSRGVNERTPLLSTGSEDDAGNEWLNPTNASINQSHVEIHGDPAAQSVGHRNYGAAKELSDLVFSGASASFDEDSLACASDANLLGRSPMCRLEDESSCARFLPVPQVEVLPFGNQTAKNDAAEIETKPRQPTDVILEKKSYNDGDIV